MIPGAPLWLQIMLGVIGAGGIGGLAVRAWDRWLGFRSASRKQTDDMALHSNAQWEARVLRVEEECRALRAEQKAEREFCDRQLSEMRHSLANELMSWEAVATGIRFRPESALDILSHVEAVRDRRRTEALEERRLRIAEERHAVLGAMRSEGQRAASSAHVSDAIAAAGAG